LENKIKALHTPGHTMESTTYLLLDENGAEHIYSLVTPCLLAMLEDLI
jgi:glyoxylase-like metal-dependent hydrolase (beta-lactamase superfamily II)